MCIRDSEGAVGPGPGSVVWATGPLASFEMDGLLGLRRPAPLDRLGDRCQVLNLGHDLHKWATVVDLSEHIYRPRGAVNGSFAVALRASVFKELLDEMSVFTAPYDSGALST